MMEIYGNNKNRKSKWKRFLVELILIVYLDSIHNLLHIYVASMFFILTSTVIIILCLFCVTYFTIKSIFTITWIMLHFLPSNLYLQSHELCFTFDFYLFIRIIIKNTLTFTSFILHFRIHYLSNRSSNILQLPLHLSKVTING